MRTSEISRKTKETDITLSLNIDGEGGASVNTGCAFLDHMLTLFGAHGGFDLDIECKGDTEVDYHHTAEDVAICLGTAFKTALGDKRGIRRYGDKVIPMDEALILSAVDFSGRCHLNYDLFIPEEKIGDFDSELVEEFFRAFTRAAECSLHLLMLAGSNSHHIAECAFKSAARSIREACEKDVKSEGKIPSTKGVL